MRKNVVLLGSTLFIVGAVVGLWSSQRNCLIAFITRGRMNFWTAMEILAGLVALTGIIIAAVGFRKRR